MAYLLSSPRIIGSLSGHHRFLTQLIKGQNVKWSLVGGVRTLQVGVIQQRGQNKGEPPAKISSNKTSSGYDGKQLLKPSKVLKHKNITD